MPSPIVLFGAFDRHNLGDLLFPHVAAALLPGRELLFAGLAERDLRPYGGHAVQALHRLARDGRLGGAHVVHLGGEVLTCSARQAAVMLLPPAEVDATLGYLERHPEAEAGWVEAMLGTAEPMPYVASQDALPGLRRRLFMGVGGVGLAGLPAPWRAAVMQRLATADAVSVRDGQTLRQLGASGIAATLMPDPAVLVPQLLGTQVRAHAAQGEVARLRAAWPDGYVAAQFSAEFGDDATLDTLADALAQALAGAGLGLVLLRAGAAPWHDDEALPGRLATRLHACAVRCFASLNVWDLCALLAHARAFVGSSLHGRIVATAYGVPAVGVRPGTGAQGKLASYAATWEPGAGAAVCPPHRLAGALQQALQRSAQARQAQAARRAAYALAACQRLLQRLD